MFSGIYQRHSTRQCRSYLLLVLLAAFTTSIRAQVSLADFAAAFFINRVL